MLPQGDGSVDRLYKAGIHHPVGDSTPRAEDCMEPGNRCGYNRTKGCILGVDIARDDFSQAELADRMPMLTPKSGAGLWMVPFRGIPATGVLALLDLIYLDADCRVIEAVEFYPTFRVSPSSPPPASVLALPVHSIFTSHTQAGDQLELEVAEKIEHRLNLLFDSMGSASAVPGAVGAREELPGNGAPRNAGDHPKEEPPESPPAGGAGLVEPGKIGRASCRERV